MTTPPIMLVQVPTGTVHRARYVLGTMPPVWRQACNARKVAGKVADAAVTEPTCARCLAEHRAVAAGVPLPRKRRPARLPTTTAALSEPVEVVLAGGAHARAVGAALLGGGLGDYPDGAAVEVDVDSDPRTLRFPPEAADAVLERLAAAGRAAVGDARNRMWLTYALAATATSRFADLPPKRRNGRPGMPERLAGLAAAKRAGLIGGWSVAAGPDGLPLWDVPEWTGERGPVPNHVLDAYLRQIPRPAPAQTEAAS